MATSWPTGFDKATPVSGQGSADWPDGFDEKLGQRAGVHGWFATEETPQQTATRALAQQGLPPAAPPAAPQKTIRDLNAQDARVLGIQAPQPETEEKTPVNHPTGLPTRQQVAETAEILRTDPLIAATPVGALNIPYGVAHAVRAPNAPSIPRTATDVNLPVTGFENQEPSLPSPEQQKAATEIVSGAGSLLGPMVAGGAVAAPIRTAAWLGGGYAAGKAARAATKAAGGGKDAQDLAEQLAFLAPVAAGTLLDPHGALIDTPEAKAAAAEVLGGRVKAGVARTPEGATTVAGKAGPFSFRKTFGGKEPTQTGLEPPTIQGQPGAVSASTPEPFPPGFTEEVPVPGRTAAKPAEATPSPTPAENAPATPREAQGTPSEIASQGKAQQPAVVKAAENIAAQVPGAKVVDPGAKPIESIERKAQDDRPITDAARAQIVVKDEAAKQQAVREVSTQLPVHEVAPIEAEHLPIVAAKLPNAGEVQIATQEEYDTQAATHDLYAKIQDAKAAGDDKKAGELQKELDHELVQRKIVGAPEDIPQKYGPGVELVPISELEKIREFDREANPATGFRDPDYLDKLTDHIRENGLEAPLSVVYNPETHHAILGSGNHRLAAAKRLGLTELPVKVTTEGVGSMRAGSEVPGHTGEVKDNFTPSDIGLIKAGGRKVEAAPEPKQEAPAGRRGMVVNAEGRPLAYSDGGGEFAEGSPFTSGIHGVNVIAFQPIHPDDVPSWAHPSKQGEFVLEVHRQGNAKSEPVLIVGTIDPNAARGHFDTPKPADMPARDASTPPAKGEEPVLESGTTVLKKGSPVTVDGQPGTLTYLSKQGFEKSRVKLDSGKTVEVPHREVAKRIQAQIPPKEGVSSQGAQVQGVTSGTPAQPTPKHGAIAVDLDDTLAKYGGFKGPTKIGAPIQATVDHVKQLLADGKEVWVYTARAGNEQSIPAIKAWTKEHIGQELPVTNVKYPNFSVFIDDRAQQPRYLTYNAEHENEIAKASEAGGDNAAQVRERRTGGVLEGKETAAGNDRAARAVAAGEGNNRQAAEDIARENVGQAAHPVSPHESAVLVGEHGERSTGGASRGHGEGAGKATTAVGTRTPQEPQLTRQSAREPRSVESRGAQPPAPERPEPPVSKSTANRGAPAAGEVGAVVRSVRGVRNNGEEVRRAGAVPELLRKGGEKAQEEPVKTPEKPFRYGSTQANIPHGSDASNAIIQARNRISDSDLAGKGKDVGGEHVTVRYGIKSDDVGQVRQYLASLAPFEATLGKTSSFPPSEHSDGAAVIIAPITSPELERINSEIGKHGDFTEPSFSQYRPHATLAYVRPEAASRYVGMDITAGKKFPITEIAITNREGVQEVVPLKGEPLASSRGNEAIPPAQAAQREERPNREERAPGASDRDVLRPKGRGGHPRAEEEAVGGGAGVAGTPEQEKEVAQAPPSNSFLEREDDRGRYRVYGNAVDVAGNWGRLKDLPPETNVVLYHATSKANAEKIMREGFTRGDKPVSGGGDRDYTYLGGWEHGWGLGSYLGGATYHGEPAIVAATVKKSMLEADKGSDWASHFKSNPSARSLAKSIGFDIKNPDAIATYATINQVRARNEHVTPVGIIDPKTGAFTPRGEVKPVAPGPGTSEYEVLKKRLAALEKKTSKPVEKGVPTAKELSAKLAKATPAPRVASPVSTAKVERAFPKSVSAPGSYGSDTVVKTPNGDVPAKYKLVEAANLLPSHDAETFAKNPGYPEGVQERTYQTSKEAQARVIQQSDHYDPAYTVNTNPDAVNGPPVVTKSGVVLGGNSRTMATQRMYRRGGGDTYKDAIEQQSASFGIDPTRVRDFSRPVLVREIPDPRTLEEARKLGSDLNKSMTGALGVSEKAVSAGKSISPETLNSISAMLDQPDATLRTAMTDNGGEIIRMLTADGVITERERPQFIDTATGGMSEEGKTFVERALRGAVVDDPVLMDFTPKSVLNKLDGSLADLVSLGQRTDEYNLLPVVREALAEHGEIARQGISVPMYYGEHVDKNFGRVKQEGMFASPTNPAVKAIVKLLAEKPSVVKRQIRQFSQDANYDRPGQSTLMLGEPPSPVSAFNSAFGTNFTEDEFQKSLVDVIEKQLQNRGEDVSRTQEEDRGTTGAVQPQQAQEAVVAPRESLLTGESGSLYPKRVLDAIKSIDKAYNRGIDALLQKAHLGRAFPEVERADPKVAADLRELAAAPAYYRAKAGNIVQKIVGGMTREQEKGFVLLADQASRDWLRENKPQEYKSYIRDDRITQSLQDYKPYEEDLRQKQKALGGPTIDEDYLRRVYAEHVAGVDKTVGKGEQKTVNANRVITPQMANKKGRLASAEYYYNNGLHEFGPSFATRYVATNLKLAEHHAAIDFLTKATKIENRDALPESLEYNGQTYFRPDVARLIKASSSDSEEGKAIAADLGIAQLPKPSSVKEYSLYDPTPSDKTDYQAKKLAQKLQEAAQNASGTKFREEDLDELLRQAAAINYSNHALYAGPKEIVEAFQSGANHVIPGWLRDVGEILSPISAMVRRQIIGLGFGVPHIKNILRRVMATSPGSQLDPRSYARAAKVLLSEELRKRGVSGVDDPAFDALLKHAGISDRGVESYKSYVQSNTDAGRMERAWNVIKAAKADYLQFEKDWLKDIKAQYREGGIGKAKAISTAIAGAVETPIRPMMFIGHHAIFGPGGIDQKSRLWLYDLIKSQEPGISDDQMAQRINDQLGRYNKASWTDFQKDIQPFTFFPGWDYSSVNWVLRHPLRTVIPAALLVLLANQVIHAFGKNKRRDATDLSHVHVGNYSVSDNIFSERLAKALAGTGSRFASSKMSGKGNEAAVRDALGGVPSDARAFVGMLNPIPATPIELATGKELATGHDIVDEKDRKRRMGPEKDYFKYALRKFFPAYVNAAAPSSGTTPTSFAVHNLGTSLYKEKRKRQ